MSKEKYIEIQQEIESYGFTIVAKDMTRPWGAFLVIKEEEVQDFANQFFDGTDVETLSIGARLSPKTLIVKPCACHSWQYHHRGTEIWQVYHGAVDNVVLSVDNYPVCDTIKKVANEYGKEYELSFVLGGDQNNDTIPERSVYKEVSIALIDGLGSKIQSSS